MIWEPGTFMIKCKVGDWAEHDSVEPMPIQMVPADGWVAFPFGIRDEPWEELTDHSAYGLTHLPTGLRICTLASMEQAQKAAERLVEETPGGLSVWEAGDRAEMAEAFGMVFRKQLEEQGNRKAAK